MTEIKFRAWDKQNKRMLYESNLILTRMADYTKSNVPYWEVMQYTGLKDKNGKEIYEGDIVGYYCKHNKKSILYEVKFGIVDSCVGVDDIIINGFYLKSLNDNHNETFNKFLINRLKIYGNIYENPELKRNNALYKK